VDATLSDRQSLIASRSRFTEPMFTRDDTIVAIATPPGHGGIGIVRLSGPDAHRIAQDLANRERPFEPRRATLVQIVLPSRPMAGAIDRAVVTTFAGPHSYTVEDVAEISAHGSPVLLRAIVAGAMRLGARLAQPGEFTFRAYLNGRLDLVQAEAVRDLVEAVTPEQARAAYDQLEGTLTRDIQAIDAQLFDLCARLEASLDFPHEGYHFVAEGAAAEEIAAVGTRLTAILADARRGRLLRGGVHVVLAGRPNTGKSSLFNSLAGAGRAIVTDTPGTTRDLISETVDIDGVPVTIVDTAGVRESPLDAVEAEGIARASAARAVAAVVVVVLDGAAPLEPDDDAVLRATAAFPRIVVANKCDRPAVWRDEEVGVGSSVIRVSALTGGGIDTLREALVDAAGGATRDVPAVTNMRHVDLLEGAQAAIDRAGGAAGAGMPEELVLQDLGEARALLEEVTGRRTPEDVLARIFSSFCIGK
jgi:tRNA modification GTPase